MKKRLLGFVLMVSLLVTPVMASASPMDGTYVGAGSAAAGILTFIFNPYTVEIGVDPAQVSIDVNGAYLPSADILSSVPISPIAGVEFWLASDTEIGFSSTLSTFKGSGSMVFSALDPVLGFMHLVFSAVGTTDYFGPGTAVTVVANGEFEKQNPTPIPGAVWLLGTGLVGLVGLRKKFQA